MPVLELISSSYTLVISCSSPEASRQTKQIIESSDSLNSRLCKYTSQNVLPKILLPSIRDCCRSGPYPTLRRRIFIPPHLPPTGINKHLAVNRCQGIRRSISSPNPSLCRRRTLPWLVKPIEPEWSPQALNPEGTPPSPHRIAMSDQLDRRSLKFSPVFPSTTRQPPWQQQHPFQLSHSLFRQPT